PAVGRLGRQCQEEFLMPPGRSLSQLSEVLGLHGVQLLYGHLAQRLAAMVHGGVSSDSSLYCCQERLLRKSAGDQRHSLPLRTRI
ncbi:hypothetical protein TSMEX_005692, partial [Taenia solium]